MAVVKAQHSCREIVEKALEFKLLKIRINLVKGKAYFVLSCVEKIFQTASDNKLIG